MRGKITFSFKSGLFKKREYYEAPILFDPMDARISYAFPMGEVIRVNFSGDIIDINYDKHVWDALRDRFDPSKKTAGFQPTKTIKPKQKKVVKL